MAKRNTVFIIIIIIISALRISVAYTKNAIANEKLGDYDQNRIVLTQDKITYMFYC